MRYVFSASAGERRLRRRFKRKKVDKPTESEGSYESEPFGIVGKTL